MGDKEAPKIDPLAKRILILPKWAQRHIASQDKIIKGQALEIEQLKPKTDFILSNNAIPLPEPSKKKKRKKKVKRVTPFSYDGLKITTSEDIENLHGKEWSEKFSKAMGNGNTGIIVPADHPSNTTGKDLYAIFYDDYERFADLVDLGKPTYFD